MLGSRTLSPQDLHWIEKAGAIILPQTCSQGLYLACKASSAELFPNYDARFKFPGKIGQNSLFDELQLPHPDTWSWISADEFRRALREKGLCHDYPFLLKGNQCHEGDGIFLIADRGCLESALRVLSSWERTGQSGFVSQALIASGGNVLRAVALENRIITYWKRPLLPESPITTVSRNAFVDKDWRKDLQARGRVQTRILSQKTGINVAAVDYVFHLGDPDPQPLILEINYYFGRRGLGGLLNYYRLLLEALQEWLQKKGFAPNLVRLL